MKYDNSEEQLYLDKCVDIIKKEVESSEDYCEKGIDYVRELAKYHWNNKEAMDDIEKCNFVYDINHSASLTNRQINRLRHLRKALENPFFGEIKVAFDDDDDEKFYIGFTSIMDKYTPVINDWRSPVASLFYNSKLGSTSYKAPMGVIDCDLQERKQIKVRNHKIVRIINSDIHIGDEVLQEVLNKSSSGKMKNIVTTIQEEQNDVIRNVKDRNIIVQGCAGSGKTSVALHRLAFLLYNDNKSTSNNMLIFSPSDTFSKYISNVLPELGEDNVLETTYSDFANTFITGFDKIESYTEFVSKYYDGLNTEEENKLNRFKFSNKYKEALDNFLYSEINKYSFKNDIYVDGYNINSGFLNRMLDKYKESNMSLEERIEALTFDVKKVVNKQKVDINKNNLKRAIENELLKKKIDPRILYNKFLESDDFINAYGKKGKKLNKSMLSYADLSGMLYLYFELVGYPKNDIIHHLVIDEVQDYSPIQIEMIKKMFNGSTLTLLGDCNQTINPYHKYDSLEDMKKIIRDSKYIELNKAYRSSPAIIKYTSNLLDQDNIIPIREKESEVMFKEVTKNELTSRILEDINTLKNNGCQRICIVTKNNDDSKEMFNLLEDKVDGISIINEKNDISTISISPAYLAKGLEFDAVILYNNVDNSYGEEDKYLYYVACTRAQHDLIIYNEPNKIKKKVLK